jgi:hypothetical protein
LIGEPVRALSDRTVRPHLQLSWLRAESGKAIRGRLHPRAGSIALQLRFLEAIRQLELRCRRLSDAIWTAPP